MEKGKTVHFSEEEIKEGTIAVPVCDKGCSVDGHRYLSCNEGDRGPLPTCSDPATGL